jgi:hypothetical protein
VPWSAVKRPWWVEKCRLAESLLAEVDDNLAKLSEMQLLGSKKYELAMGTDRMELFGDELQKQLAKAYEKVTTINDALVKYQRFRSAMAGQEDYEKKNAEFQQFLAWYREGLNTALQNLRTRLADELKEPKEPENWRGAGEPASR